MIVFLDDDRAGVERRVKVLNFLSTYAAAFTRKVSIVALAPLRPQCVDLSPKGLQFGDISAVELSEGTISYIEKPGNEYVDNAKRLSSMLRFEKRTERAGVPFWRPRTNGPPTLNPASFVQAARAEKGTSPSWGHAARSRCWASWRPWASRSPCPFRRPKAATLIGWKRSPDRADRRRLDRNFDAKRAPALGFGAETSFK